MKWLFGRKNKKAEEKPKYLTINWEDGERMKNPAWLEQFEKEKNYRFPEIYRSLVLEHDGASPDRMFFDMGGMDYDLDRLLTFNPDSSSSIWIERDYEDEVERMKQYVGFAEDSAGDEICFDKKDDSIVYICSDTSEVTKIAPDFQSFLEMLREEERIAL